MRKYAIAVGELLWAANSTQASLADLFSALVDSQQLDAGLAIWLSIQTDRGQLTALDALLGARATSKTRLHRSVRWAIAAVEKLAEVRNDAAHMATAPTMSVNGPTLIPSPIGNTASRLQRRSGTNFLELFGRAKGDYVQVQQYVHQIFCHLVFTTEPHPLPLRPKLKSVVVRPPHKK